MQYCSQFSLAQTQSISITKTAILNQQAAEHDAARAISISRQKLNKSLSEPQIDVTKIRQKHQLQKHQQEKQMRSASVSSNHSEHSEEAEAKNGCAII